MYSKVTGYKSNFKVGDFVCCKDEHYYRVWYFTKPYKILMFITDNDDNQVAILDKDIPGLSFPDNKGLQTTYLKLHPATYRVKKLKRILYEN